MTTMPSAFSQREQRGGAVITAIVVLLVLLICWVLYLVRAPILRSIGERWIVEDPLERSDALIILSDDNFYADRATRAAELFRRGMAPEIVASGRRLRPFAGIAELMVHDLLERGVPKDKIEAFPQDADNTREEAMALAQFAARKKWRSVIVVTSNYHTRRARYIFHRIFPSTVRVRIACAPDGDFDPERWWQHRKSIKKLTTEMAGFTVAIWELWGHSATSGASQSIVGLMGLIPQQVV
jgi:uncharacterized SAM-binding protein YcdF (DUF218 family)